MDKLGYVYYVHPDLPNDSALAGRKLHCDRLPSLTLAARQLRVIPISSLPLITLPTLTSRSAKVQLKIIL